MSTTTAVLITSTASATAATTSAVRVASQGGVIEGSNPSVYNPKDPITLFIIQAGLIIIVCHLLHWPLSKLRQPRVIAEVLGGIILGPSVMGHVPGFRSAIFPTESIPNLTLVANLGLVLYLFLIGLETDVRFLVSNWRIASSVAFAGIALPFGLGCALAWGIYNQFAGEADTVVIKFPVYMLFIGIAMAITAFPVLCRILTELKLLDTSVGVITLSAGVANDVVGWILLALCVTLVNAGSGLSSLWILLTCVGYVLFLLYAVKPALGWLLRRTGSIENGPSQSIIALILLVALASAFFTGIIGVHPIFGGFVVGLIIPREGGFTIKVTEKLEDLIGAIFLPLYFTLSGLNTDLSLLDNGITWGYVFAVTLVAFFTKLSGATLAARFNGLVWRESFTIGVLMSCKGLVELIVLNIGLQAKILSTRTFTIFVVMALLTTFTTTPLAIALYPPSYQKKLEAWKRGEIDWDSGEPVSGPSDGQSGDSKEPRPVSDRVRRLLVYLRLDSMPAVLDLVSLFGMPSAPEARVHPSNKETSGLQPGGPNDPTAAVRAHGIRLVQLTDRDSSVMTVSQVEDFNRRDPVVKTFQTVGQLHRVAVSAEVAVIPETRFAGALANKYADMSSDLLLLPWSESGSLGDAQVLPEGANDKLSSTYTSFVKSVLQSVEHNIAVLFTQTKPRAAADPGADKPKLHRAYSFSDTRRDIATIPVTNKFHHIFLPYLGGEDDKLALSLVLQLCEKPDVTATVVNFFDAGSSTPDSYFASASASLSAKLASRVKFETATAGVTVEGVLDRAASEIQPDSRNTTWVNLVILGRGAGEKTLEDRAPHKVSEDVKECLGLVGGNFVLSGLKIDVLVVQATRTHTTTITPSKEIRHA